MLASCYGIEKQTDAYGIVMIEKRKGYSWMDLEKGEKGRNIIG